MATRRNLAMLAELADLRRVQQQAAEQAMARAEAALQQARREQSQAGDVLAGRLGDWSRVMSGPSIALDQARAWASAVLDAETQVRRKDEETASSEQDCSRRRSDWGFAAARLDVARTLERTARRGLQRRFDERQLADQADRSARASERP